MKSHYIALTLAACLMAVPAAAQQRDTVAQRELQEALEQLRRAQTTEARRGLDDVMRELRRAQAELQSRFGFVEVMPGGVAVYTGSRNPQMGVYLDYAARTDGARIERVVGDGPAAKAGLQSGDVIVKAKDEDLTGNRRAATRLVAIKDRMDIGDTLRVEYRRGSETRTANIVLGRVEPVTSIVSGSRVSPADVAARMVQPGRGIALSWGFPAGWLDIELISLDEDLGRYFGTSDGLLVVNAPEDQTLQLRSGDVILQVDGREPTDQSHLLRILRSYAAGETMQLTIMRDRRRQTLNVTVPERDDGFFWR